LPVVSGCAKTVERKDPITLDAIEAHAHNVQVPLFVSQDDMIEIDTRTNEYKRIIRS
jgi:elongation factor P